MQTGPFKTALDELEADRQKSNRRNLSSAYLHLSNTIREAEMLIVDARELQKEIEIAGDCGSLPDAAVKALYDKAIRR